MSKETKFLSIAIGLLQGQLREKGIKDKLVEDMTADRLLNFIQCVDVVCGPGAARRTNEVDHKASNERNTLHRNGLLPDDKNLGSIFVETTCDGLGTPAQIKFFKLLEGETPEEFDRVNGKITMIRDITGFDGCLRRYLREGRYVVEISKGSEYEIITDYLEVKKGELEKRNYELKRFIDLDKMGWISGDLHHHSIYSSPVFKGDDDVVETPQ